MNRWVLNLWFIYKPANIPSGKLTLLWKITIFKCKHQLFLWPFSIAMFVYQRVTWWAPKNFGYPPMSKMARIPPAKPV